MHEREHKGRLLAPHSLPRVVGRGGRRVVPHHYGAVAHVGEEGRERVVVEGVGEQEGLEHFLVHAARHDLGGVAGAAAGVDRVRRDIAGVGASVELVAVRRALHGEQELQGRVPELRVGRRRGGDSPGELLRRPGEERRGVRDAACEEVDWAVG